MNMQPIGATQTSAFPTTPAVTPERAPQPASTSATSPQNQATQGVASKGSTTQGVVAEQPDKKEVEEAAKQASEFVKKFHQGAESSLRFEVNDDIGKMIVKVVDIQTKEVIRQIPSEEMIQIAKTLDKLQGMLIRSSA